MSKNPILRIGGMLPLALLWLCAAMLAMPAAAQTLRPKDPAQSFRALCYHDIRDNVRDSFRTWPEQTAVDTRDLVQQFSWLQENGYQPVSLQQIIDARAGRAALPEKAILLTFDDGYRSAYTKVFPLLKQFNFPAVIALVGEWMETPGDQQVQYGDGRLPRDEFLNWDEVREMVASGLVEVASHSYDMHKGVPANPQGNLVAAAISRNYTQQTGKYESEAAYAARIKSDLRRNAELIERELRARPRTMVWPYGAYNLHGVRWAAEAGMPVTMTLEPGPNTPADPLGSVRRTLITYDTGLAGLARLLQQPASHDGAREPRERVIHVDLDYVFDPDPGIQEANLSRLLDRIARLRPTTVYLQAFSDGDGDGVADALYFPNRHLPVRADLFSRAAWQLRTRARVKVYAWMPVLAFKLPDTHPAAAHIVEIMPGAPESARDGRYHRLSPFDPVARRTIMEMYEDLGKHAVFGGVLFHDDATLSDYEDASPSALRVYREQWGLSGSLEAIRRDSEMRRRWSERKTAHLNAFTLDLAQVLREYQPGLMTARNLYAQPVLNAEAEEWYAQSLRSFLTTYDFTAVMAMPYMEEAADPRQWLDRLFAKIKAEPNGLAKTVIEMQSRDWKTGKPVPAQTLAAHWRRLHLAGARHWGYYPDDFHRNQPDETAIRQAISVETFPVRR